MSRLLTLEISAAWLASGAIVAMSDATISTVVVALCAAIPPTIVAWAALQQAKRAAEKIAETEKKVEATSEQNVALIEKTDEIHTLANSQLSKVTAALETANSEIKASNQRIIGLEQLVTSLVDSEKKLAAPAAAVPEIAAVAHEAVAGAIREAAAGVSDAIRKVEP